jgi:DNA polymerase-3 subunit delta'
MWEVIGQKRAVSLLQRSLKSGAVSHAYMFIGPAHSGKMTLARDLAKALNCQGEEPPCGQCDPCRKIQESKHADVQVTGISSDDTGETKSKTEIGIDRIRQLQHSASLPPFEGKYKVYIIENAEMLSVEAANALLKTLEEPESRMVFILLVSDSNLLLETVVSRCQKVELVPVSLSEAEDALVKNWGVESEKAALLARLSRGRLGWAVSAALDESITEQRTEMLERMLEVIDADTEERFAYSSQLATKFGQDRGYVYDRLDMWLDWWRDMLLIKTGLGDNITNIDRIDELKKMAGGRNLSGIREFIRGIQTAGEQLRQNANPRLALEVLMLDIPEAGLGKKTVSSDTR